MTKFASVLFGVGTIVLAASLLPGAAAQTQTAIPNFAADGASWRTRGGEIFIPVPGAPAPTGNDTTHPYIHNVDAHQLGVQPTFRISDTNNPNLTAEGQDEKLGGKIQKKVGQIEKVLEK